MTRVILRYDDFSALSDINIETRIFSAVAERGCKIAVSIVPFVAEMNWNVRGPINLIPLPEEKLNLLKRFMPDCVEPALHGYSHQAVSRFSNLCEFADGIDYDMQAARIRDAKDYLENNLSRPLRVFVPPWNAYGSNTLAALQAAGIEIVSGDAASGPLAPGIKFIPSTCQMGEVAKALDAAKTDTEALVCVLIHEYDFIEGGNQRAYLDVKSFGCLLDRAQTKDAQWIHFSDYLESEDLKEERARANQTLREAMKSPFRHILKPGTRGVYWSTDVASRKQRIMGLLNRLKL